MDDKYLITLYQARNEDAIKETETAYGKLLYSIAWHVLADHQRCEECVNDTYLKAWESIPPETPQSFVAYLGRIVRNLAINRWNAERAQKRFNPGDIALGELADMLPSKQDTAAPTELKVVTESINRWLKTLGRSRGLSYRFRCPLVPHDSRLLECFPVARYQQHSLVATPQEDCLRLGYYRMPPLCS